MLTVSLANVLIFNNDALTPWTNISLGGVTDYSSPYYDSNPSFGYAIDANASIHEFANVINNMEFNFTYDYAIAIMK